MRIAQRSFENGCGGGKKRGALRQRCIQNRGAARESSLLRPVPEASKKPPLEGASGFLQGRACHESPTGRRSRSPDFRPRPTKTFLGSTAAREPERAIRLRAGRE